MADNLTAPAAGAVLASDEIAGIHHPRTKIQIGADGSASDVHAGNPLPVSSDVPGALKSSTPTRTTVNSSTTSATIVASNANRKGATICNTDANALLLDLSGGTAAASRYQVRLIQNQTYEIGHGYTGAVTGVWEDNGDGRADVVEFT